MRRVRCRRHQGAKQNRVKMGDCNAGAERLASGEPQLFSVAVFRPRREPSESCKQRVLTDLVVSRSKSLVYSFRVMSIHRSKICALILVLAIMPGSLEVFESAFHLMTEGHLAHAAADGDHHEEGPEHGCTPIFHVCGCHASLSFVGPQVVPKVCLRASFAVVALTPVAPPSGFWPSIDHPPRS